MARPPVRRLAAAIITFAMLSPTAAFAPAVRAGSIITVNEDVQSINDNDKCSLSEAIFAANRDDNTAPDPANPADDLRTGCIAGSGADTIYLPGGAVYTVAGPVADPLNYLGPTATPIISSTIVIEGQGARLQRGTQGGYTRAFAVGSGGNLTVHELHVKGFAVHGGNGSDGGGGGLGAGGAIYVHYGSLSIGWSTFENNGAIGGDGGGDRSQVDLGGFYVGGGGGGLGGDGGAARIGGGGGGGARGAGGSGNVISCNPPPGELCEFGFGGGGGGTLRNGYPGTSGGAIGGERCGATGGGTQSGDPGLDATCGGGGGGGGNSGFIATTGGVLDLLGGYGGNGGSGGYGGGGGGAGWGSTLLGYGTDGGHGGFGGGGGGAGGMGSSGGDGGFGGGGGAGLEYSLLGGPGSGGTFAGDGDASYGGGGAGLGGAIFGHVATITIENSTFVANYANRGHYGGGNAHDGRGAGGAIFAVGGVLTINSATIAGNATGEYNLDNGVKVGLGGGGIAVYDPIGDDEATLHLRNTIVAGNDNAECYTRNGVTTTGSWGNLVVDSTVNTHGDVPCPGVVASSDPALGPLAVNLPGRTPTMSIQGGSPAADAAVGASPADDQRGVLRPQGAAADIGAYEASGTPPVTTITLAPTSPDGSNGWYRSAVGVTISATDADSNVAQTRCVVDPASTPGGFYDLPDAACGLSSVGADGEHGLFAGSVDEEGNVEQPLATASFKVDRTNPTLSPTLSSATVTLNQAGITASPNASDATSGIASAGCGAIDTSTPGPHTVTCTATDNAGNTASVDVGYVVEYRVLGFFSPVPMSKWKLAQTVPIKVALADAAGVRLADEAAGQLAAACRVTFSASGAQSKSAQCMKYDAAMDQFVYAWRLGKKGTGQATIRVSIGYPGTTYRTQLSEVIVITK